MIRKRRGREIRGEGKQEGERSSASFTRKSSHNTFFSFSLSSSLSLSLSHSNSKQAGTEARASTSTAPPACTTTPRTVSLILLWFFPPSFLCSLARSFAPSLLSRSTKRFENTHLHSLESSQLPKQATAFTRRAARERLSPRRCQEKQGRKKEPRKRGLREVVVIPFISFSSLFPLLSPSLFERDQKQKSSEHAST